jgi:hypothetical protein
MESNDFQSIGSFGRHDEPASPDRLSPLEMAQAPAT